MDFFEINKITGAFLATIFMIFTLGIVSNSIFAVSLPQTQGFAIVVPGAEESSQTVAAAAETGAPAAVPIAELVAKADPVAGKAQFKKCLACHTDTKGGANRIGPNLWNIVNRPMATHEGFSYSAALKAFAKDGTVVWDYDHLSEFVTSPKTLIKGTAMTFPGLKKVDDRANLLAYLRELADTPAPLTAPAAEEAAPAEMAPAAEEAAPAEMAPAAEEAAPAETAPAAEETAPVEQTAPQ